MRDASCLLLPLQIRHKSTAADEEEESDERQSKDVLGIKPITLLYSTVVRRTLLLLITR